MLIIGRKDVYLRTENTNRMKKLQITETSMALAKQWENSGYLEDDLLLLEQLKQIALLKQ